jgi:hypothetical protein
MLALSVVTIINARETSNWELIISIFFSSNVHSPVLCCGTTKEVGPRTKIKEPHKLRGLNMGANQYTTQHVYSYNYISSRMHSATTSRSICIIAACP